MYSVLWDKDGVICDTWPAFVRFARQLFVRSGRQIPFKTEAELRMQIHGDYRKQYVTWNFDLEGKDRAFIYGLYNEIVSSQIHQPHAGVPSLIHKLHRKGVHQGVVSTAPQGELTKDLKSAGLHTILSPQICLDHVGIDFKPHPLGLLLALETMQHHPIYFVGDMADDIYTVHKAREHTKRDIRSVAVPWGYGDRSQIEAAKPDYIVNNVAELERVLKAA